MKKTRLYRLTGEITSGEAWTICRKRCVESLTDEEIMNCITSTEYSHLGDGTIEEEFNDFQEALNCLQKKQTTYRVDSYRGNYFISFETFFIEEFELTEDGDADDKMDWEATGWSEFAEIKKNNFTKITVNKITAENVEFTVNNSKWISVSSGTKITFPTGNIAYVEEATAGDVFETALDFTSENSSDERNEECVINHLADKFVVYDDLELDEIKEVTGSEYV